MTKKTTKSKSTVVETVATELDSNGTANAATESVTNELESASSTNTEAESVVSEVDSTSSDNAEAIEAVQITEDSVTSDSNGSTVQSANGVSTLEPPSVATSIPDVTIPPTGTVNNMAQNTSPASSNTQTTTTVTTDTTTQKTSGSNVSAVYGNYDNYQLLPEAPWPPPIFVRQDISPQERYYIEHRWYSQWSFFDAKATENKNRYYRTQLIVGLGSVTVPVLVGIRANDTLVSNVLYLVTVVISLAVAMSTAIESLYTFGDNWRSYRSAAEDLHQEKSLYDVKAGRYMNNPQAFLRFVERCEEIIAQQNGRWVQSQEKAAEQAKELGEDFLAEQGGQHETDQYGNKVVSRDRTRTTTVEETFSEDFVPTTTDTSVEPATSDQTQTEYSSAG